MDDLLFVIRSISVVALALLFFVGIFGLAKKSKKKKLFVAFIIIPVLLVYSIYFSGFFRRAPFDEQSVREIIETVPQLYDNKGELKGSSENGTVEYTAYIHDGKMDNAEDLYFWGDRLIDSVFSKTGECDGKAYYIGQASSDKGSHWELSRHDGYVGVISIQLNDAHYLELHYKISRKIDKALGFLYAPPMFGKYSFANL